MPAPATRVDDPQRAPASAAKRRCATCGASYPLDFLVCPKDATNLDTHDGRDDDPLVGEVLAGAFCIVGQIGSGGMGRVYEAEHVRLPRRFAVKVINEDLARHPDAIARFEREAQAAARIVNEHVLDVVDVVRTRDGRACMVTELLQGEELGDVLDREHKLPLPQAIAICRQVCRGLAAAHAQGVVHRDLKPSNLFLIHRDPPAQPGLPPPRDSARLHVKILDFGVAKMTDGADLTRTGMVVGTPAYMSPEQARGSKVDTRADIYAVGAVLYHLVTGQPPFGDDEPARILARLVHEDPQRPRDLDRSIPEGIELLIQRAMARSPDDRPATVLDLDRHLSAFDDQRRGEAAALAARRTDAMIGHMDTMAVDSTPSSQLALDALTPRGHMVSEADDATRRARRARPAAVFLTLAVSMVVGTSVLATSTLALRTIVERAVLSETELMLLFVLSTIAMIFALFGVGRTLTSRWRSAPAVERLGEGLRSAILTMLGMVGALALGWQGYAAVSPPPAAWLPEIQLALVLVPTVLGVLVLALVVRRATKGG
jgi:tRNA A-37 threonylcarbamoyl transferase component Bud32